MNAIPLFDLADQFALVQDEIRRRIESVFDSQRFILGPEVEELEQALASYVDVRHAIGCASGTDALLLPLKALQGSREDEVVVPTFTFFATAGAVWNAGLKPVFCDVDPETYNVTAQTVDAARTSRTVAVVPVHLFGQMAPIEEIASLPEMADLLILEDAAQATGAARAVHGESIRAGALGDAGAFSFFPTKNLGGFGDGGLVTTNDDALAGTIRRLRVHGGRKMYEHELVGTNSRLDTVQAAVLLAKLRYLDGWLESRRRHARLYTELLSDVDGVRLPKVDSANSHTFNQYTIRADRRDQLRGYLADRGIGSAIYYPVPLHLQPCFADLGYREGDFPVSEQLCREVLSLPVYPELGEDRAAQVAEAVRAFYGASPSVQVSPESLATEQR